MVLEATRVLVTPLRQNCQIVGSSHPDHQDRAVVIDPGGDVDDVMRALNGRKVQAILLTHGHFDHAGGAMELAERCAARDGARPPVLGPQREDEFLLDAIERQADYFGLSGMRNVKVDEWTQEGDVIPVLDGRLEVLHVPGHTPGHVVFHDRDAGRLFTGDTLMRGTVGRSDFEYGDGAGLLGHIQNKIMTLPPETRVLAGHGRETTVQEERASNPFLNGLMIQ